jgi:uncharacterized protein involved in outer membrane biogenesis
MPHSSNAGRERGRMLRPILTGIGVAVALVIALLGAVAFLDDTLIREAVVKTLAERTGRDVAIEHLRIQPFSPAPRVKVSGLRIGNAEWAKARHMAELDDGEVAISVAHLLIGRIVLQDVRLQGPRLFLERDARGRSNWAFGDRESAPQRSRTLPAVRSFRVADAYGEILEGGRRSFIRLTVDRIDDAERPVAASGEGEWRGAPLKVSARAGAVDTLMAGSEPYPLVIEVESGRATFAYDGEMRPADPAQPFAGRVRAKGRDAWDLRDLAGISLPHTKPYEITARLARREDGWHVEDIDGRVGASDLRGALSLLERGDRPFLQARLSSKRLDLADLGGLVGAPPQRPNSAKRSDRVVPDEPLDMRGLNRFDADVLFEAERFLQSARLPLDRLRAHLVLDHGRLTIDPLDFGVAKGTVATRVRLDARRQPMTASADVRFERLRLAELLPRADGSAGGTGAIDGRAKLTSRGGASDALLAHLNGDVGLVMRGGEMSNLLLEIAGLDAGEAVKFLVGGDRRVPIRCGVASFKAVDGVLNSEVLVLDTQDTKITGEARVDLGREMMQISLYPQPKDPSIAVLRAPLHIKGPFAKPSVGVDKTAIAARAGAALLLGMVNPLLALVPMVETGGGEDADCGALVRDVTAGKDVGRSPKQ